MAAWQQEVTKAVLAAIATTIATQIASFLAVLADPNSPSRILSDGRKTMDFVEAWGKTSEQIQKLPKSQLRDDAQAEIDDLLQKYQVGRESYAAIYQQRRATLLRILVFLRLSGLRGGYRRVAAFFFYIAVVLLIQTIRLVWAGEMSWDFIGWFTLAAVLFWLLSFSGRMSKA